jgi:hypothetical protein
MSHPNASFFRRPLVALTAGIGLAANEVTGDSVGLSADPLEAGDSLAPPAGGRGERLGDRERTSDSQTGAAGQDPLAPAPIPQPITPAPAPTPEPFDDHGGDRSGSDDNSGPGSSDDNSGPGSNDD